jgi:hypothetical protein
MNQDVLLSHWFLDHGVHYSRTIVSFEGELEEDLLPSSCACEQLSVPCMFQEHGLHLD